MSDELIQSFSEVSEPLVNTAKSISLSITALKSLGKIFVNYVLEVNRTLSSNLR